MPTGVTPTPPGARRLERIGAGCRKRQSTPILRGLAQDSRALAAAFVRSGRFEFGTVGSVWATHGQGVWASEFAGFAKFIVGQEVGDAQGDRSV